MIVNEWRPEFRRQYGDHFPETYMALDTEYTGSDVRRDLLLEFGHVLVEDGVVHDRMGVVLNWYQHPGVDAAWLDYKLNTMRNIVGPGWQLLPDYVKERGIDPIKGLRLYAKMLEVWAKRGRFFVAQNGLAAEEKIIRGCFDRFLNRSFSFPENQYFDTGGLYKATVIRQSTDADIAAYRDVVLPRPTETLKQYFARIIGMRVRGVRWSLDTMLQFYGLDDRHDVQTAERHSAEFDSLCLFWLMEEMRKRIVPQTPAEQNPFQSAEAIQSVFDTMEAEKHLQRDVEEAKPKATTGYQEPPSPRRPGQRKV